MFWPQSEIECVLLNVVQLKKNENIHNVHGIAWVTRCVIRNRFVSPWECQLTVFLNCLNDYGNIGQVYIAIWNSRSWVLWWLCVCMCIYYIYIMQLRLATTTKVHHSYFYVIIVCVFFFFLNCCYCFQWIVAKCNWMPLTKRLRQQKKKQKNTCNKIQHQENRFVDRLHKKQILCNDMCVCLQRKYKWTNNLGLVLYTWLWNDDDVSKCKSIWVSLNVCFFFIFASIWISYWI